MSASLELLRDALALLLPSLAAAAVASLPALAADRFRLRRQRGLALASVAATIGLFVLARFAISSAVERHDRIWSGTPRGIEEYRAALRNELNSLRTTGHPSPRLQSLTFGIHEFGEAEIRDLIEMMHGDVELGIRSRELSNALADGLSEAIRQGRFQERDFASAILPFSPHVLRSQRRVRESERLPIEIQESPAGLAGRLEEWPDYPLVPRNRHRWRGEVMGAALVGGVRQDLEVKQSGRGKFVVDVPVVSGAYTLEVTWKSELLLGENVVASKSFTERRPLAVVEPHESDAEVELPSDANPFVGASMLARLIECGDGWAMHVRLSLRPRINEKMGIGAFTLHFAGRRETCFIGSSDDLTTRSIWSEGRSMSVGKIAPPSPATVVSLVFQNTNYSRYTSSIKEVGWARRSVVATAIAEVVPLPERWWLPPLNGRPDGAANRHPEP